MKKFVCTICGYVHEGDAAPEKCPICKAGAGMCGASCYGKRGWMRYAGTGSGTDRGGK